MHNSGEWRFALPRLSIADGLANIQEFRNKRRAARTVFGYARLGTDRATRSDMLQRFLNEARYGLAQTSGNREIIERAIVLVNEALPRDMPLRLRPTWPQSGFYPTLYFEEKRNTAFAMEDVIDREFDNGWRFRNADEIPVFIVDATSLGEVETVFVSEGARTIFISGRHLERQFDTFYLRGAKAWEQYSSFEKSLVTAVILLHELGHVHFDDAAATVIRHDLHSKTSPSLAQPSRARRCAQTGSHPRSFRTLGMRKR